MTGTGTAFSIGLMLIGAVVNPASAQAPRPAVFAAAGAAHIFRAEDRSFGTELNVGGGVGVEWNRFGVDIEAHRTVGLTPRPVACAVGNVPCAGSAREGLSQATMLSGNVSYFFSGQRLRPFITGSVGVLLTESVNSLTTVTDGAATISEFQERDTGLAIGAGFGVDVPLAPTFSLRPAFRIYSSAAMSRVNVGIYRGTIDLRYRW